MNEDTHELQIKSLLRICQTMPDRAKLVKQIKFQGVDPYANTADMKSLLTMLVNIESLGFPGSKVDIARRDTCITDPGEGPEDPLTGLSYAKNPHLRELILKDLGSVSPETLVKILHIWDLDSCAMDKVESDPPWFGWDCPPTSQATPTHRRRPYVYLDVSSSIIYDDECGRILEKMSDVTHLRFGMPHMIPHTLS